MWELPLQKHTAIQTEAARLMLSEWLNLVMYIMNESDL